MNAGIHTGQQLHGFRQDNKRLSMKCCNPITQTKKNIFMGRAAKHRMALPASSTVSGDHKTAAGQKHLQHNVDFVEVRRSA